MKNWHDLEFEINNGEVLFYRSWSGAKRCVMRMASEDFALLSGFVPNPSVRQLLRKAAQIAVLAASCGCAREGPLIIDTTEQPDWLVESVHEAADFWALHDVQIKPEDNADGIKLQVVRTTIVNRAFAEWVQSSNTIRVSTRLEAFTGPTALEPGPNVAICSIAHEIGHALGMNHVTARSENLMSPVTSIPAEGCWWGAEDQIELCRVTGCGDK